MSVLVGIGFDEVRAMVEVLFSLGIYVLDSFHQGIKDVSGVAGVNGFVMETTLIVVGGEGFCGRLDLSQYSSPTGVLLDGTDFVSVEAVNLDVVVVFVFACTVEVDLDLIGFVCGGTVEVDLVLIVVFVFVCTVEVDLDLVDFVCGGTVEVDFDLIVVFVFDCTVEVDLDFTGFVVFVCGAEVFVVTSSWKGPHASPLGRRKGYFLSVDFSTYFPESGNFVSASVRGVRHPSSRFATST